MPDYNAVNSEILWCILPLLPAASALFTRREPAVDRITSSPGPVLMESIRLKALSFAIAASIIARRLSSASLLIPVLPGLCYASKGVMQQLVSPMDVLYSTDLKLV